jgi:hypothetical protein
VRVSYDPDLEALSVEFILWPLHSVEDLDLAFGSLLPRIAAIVGRRCLGRVPLLLDLAGLEVAGEVEAGEVERALDHLISSTCPECAPNRLLAIRYDSRRASAPRRRAALSRIKLAGGASAPDPDHGAPSQPGPARSPLPALLALLDAPLASRDEAVALLRRLRSPASSPSSSRERPGHPFLGGPGRA